MDVNIQAIHFDASERLISFINRKAERLAHRYEAITTLDVTLKVIKPETTMNKVAVIRAVVPQLDDFVADKTADSFEEAVDLALEAVERQLEKKKSKK